MKSSTKSLITLGLIGAAGYYLWRKLNQSKAPAAASMQAPFYLQKPTAQTKYTPAVKPVIPEGTFKLPDVAPGEYKIPDIFLPPK